MTILEQMKTYRPMYKHRRLKLKECLSGCSYDYELRQYIIVTIKCKMQLAEIIIFTKATVVKTTEPGLIWLTKGRAKA